MVSWGFNPGCQDPRDPHVVLHCVSIIFILLIWTLCLKEKAMEREIEHACRGWGGGCKVQRKSFKWMQVEVSQTHFPLSYVLLQHYSFLAFLFSGFFLISPLLGDLEDGWGDCLFTGPPTGPILIT